MKRILDMTLKERLQLLGSALFLIAAGAWCIHERDYVTGNAVVIWFGLKVLWKLF